MIFATRRARRIAVAVLCVLILVALVPFTSVTVRDLLLMGVLFVVVVGAVKVLEWAESGDP